MYVNDRVDVLSLKVEKDLNRTLHKNKHNARLRTVPFFFCCEHGGQLVVEGGGHVEDDVRAAIFFFFRHPRGFHM